ncbi:MAG TPA: nitroreductase family protein [Chloroflexia bacterium]|nr:nitroreductase family protein [Chloroflexia bacterium]
MTETTNLPLYPFVPLRFKRLPEERQLENSRHFLETMRQRRTVRYFSREPVPYELIENAIATAGTAPSGANQQPWTFAVVSNPELKRRIREVAEAEEKESYEHRMSQEWLEALAPLGTDWHKEHLEDAPYLIIVFEQAYGLRGGPEGQERKVKHYYAQESVGIAVGLLLASLHQAGLATLTHTPSPMGFLIEILGRPRNERPFVVIPVGYPAPGCTVPDIGKKPLDQILVRYD